MEVLAPNKVRNTLAIATVALFGMNGELAVNPDQAEAQDPSAFVCPPGQHDVHTVDAEGNTTDYCEDDNPQPDQPSSTPKPHKSHDARDYYKDPLRFIYNLKALRIDMGVDYKGSGPVKALGEGRVTAVKRGTSNFWPANNVVVYKLSEGPAKKRSVFVAENCTPNVYIGQKVHSWTTVCNMHNSYPNIEMGWARGHGSERPLAHGYYREGQKTAHGANFNNLMTYLGAPSGTSSGRATVGSLPENFPRWPH